jgi:hypothetical protein
MTAHKPRVVLIGAGGTISSLGRHTLDWEYMDHGRLQEPEELVERLPEATREADVIPVRFRPLSSAKLGPPEWLEVPPSLPQPPVPVGRIRARCLAVRLPNPPVRTVLAAFTAHGSRNRGVLP